MQIPPRGRTQQSDKKVQCYEPATMKYLGFFPALSSSEVRGEDIHMHVCIILWNLYIIVGNVWWQVHDRVEQARKAQKIWAKSSFKQRRQFLRILLKYIIEHQELICE